MFKRVLQFHLWRVQRAVAVILTSAFRMAFRMAFRLAFGLAFGLAIGFTSFALATNCEELSPTSTNVMAYGTDYLPRLDFHDGLEAETACVYDLPDALPAEMNIPLYGFNLQNAITGVRFRLIASVPLVTFTPSEDLTEIGGETVWNDEDYWYLDISLVAEEICGPLVIGEVTLSVPEGTESYFVDLLGFLAEQSPVFVYNHTIELPVVQPRHGAYAGQVDLYHCQPPLCVQPNTAVSEFQPIQSGGEVIELGWKGGGGDFTMIRYRTDGLHPTSIFDGELLTLMPSYPQQDFAIFHDNPQFVQYWYSAFSVTMVGEEVVLGSQLECDSFTTATVDESVGSESTTWGVLKSKYR